MKNIKEYISSGIIEMYVLGLTSEEENKEIVGLSEAYPEILDEIEAVSEALMLYNKACEPVSPKVKPFLMATIDYTERLKSGEAPAIVPSLSSGSTIGDYEEWISREDMVLDEEAGDPYAKIIGYTPGEITAIVWMKDKMPYELHEKEYEKLLVIEGSCEIILDSRTVVLTKGDYFSIPLSEGHTIKITSEIPCKVILQRQAA